MKNIYLSKKPYTEDGNYWLSFESDSFLSVTKTNIYTKCLPCIENLLHQLEAGKQTISLGRAFSCWKITVISKDMDECMSLLEEYENKYLNRHIYGKLGGGKDKPKSKVVVFHADTDEEKDILLAELKECSKHINPDARVTCTRGCSSLFEIILGDSSDWEETTPIKYPERVPSLIEKIRKLLYYSKDP